MARVTLLPIKREPFVSMHLGRTKVHLLVQRQKHGARDAGAILERHGVKTFAGYYHDHQRGEIITAAREKVFVSFGEAFVRVDAGDATWLLHRSKDAPTLSLRRGGAEVGRGKLAPNASFLDTHDADFLAVAPEVLILLAFQGLPPPPA